MGIVRNKLLINGQEVDIADNRSVAQSFQGIDIAKLGTIASDFTPKIRLEATSRTNKAISNLNDKQGQTLFNEYVITEVLNGVASKTKRVDFPIDVKVTLLQNGVEVIYDGVGKITQASDSYLLNILSGSYSFMQSISALSLRDIDMSDKEFTFTRDLQYDRIKGTASSASATVTWSVCEFGSGDGSSSGTINHWYNGKGEIFDDPVNADEVLDRTLKTPKVMMRYLPPFIRVLPIWDRIFGTVDFTANAEFRFDTQEFQNLFIAGSPLVGFNGWREGTVYDPADFMPDVPVTDFVKALLLQFGCFLVSEDRVVSVIFLNTLYSADPIDWSDKLDVTQRPVITYDLGLSRINDISWATEPTENDYYVGSHSLAVEFPVASVRQALFTIPAAPIDMITYDINSPNGYGGGTEKQPVGTATWPFPFISGGVTIEGISWKKVSSGHQHFETESEQKPNVTWGEIGLVFAMWDLHTYNITQSTENSGIEYAANLELVFTNANGVIIRRDVVSSGGVVHMHGVKFVDNTTDILDNTDADVGDFRNFSSKSSVGSDLSTLSPEYIADTWYELVEFSMLKQNKKVSARFRLSSADMNLLKFADSGNNYGRARPIRVDALGGSYMITNIKSFQPDRLVTVELTKL
jgi:hypothetical protein